LTAARAAPGRLFEITGAGPLQPDPDPNPVTGQRRAVSSSVSSNPCSTKAVAAARGQNGAFVNIRGANGAVLPGHGIARRHRADLPPDGTGTRLQTKRNGIELANNARLQTQWERRVVRIRQPGEDGCCWPATS